MIKLFWNTHNQIKPSENKEKSEDSLNYIWGMYHQKNSNTWVNKVLKKVQFKMIQNESNLEKNDVLIIVDSSVEKKIELYKKLNLICSKVFLIHLGDESASHDLSLIYKNCNHVWRTFCSNRFFNNKSVSCLPLGYKSGITDKKLDKREYKWAFVGTPHKSSRHDLIFQFSNLKPFFSHKTKKFNEKIISVDEMNNVFSSTQFIPCPNGFVHPETYRLYEALECGCIPIVENAYQYYDRLFPNNPFLKVDKWSDAKSILSEWDNDKIENKRKECLNWWINYQNELQEEIKNKITT